MVNRAANCVTVYGIDDDGKIFNSGKAFAALADEKVKRQLQEMDILLRISMYGDLW